MFYYVELVHREHSDLKRVEIHGCEHQPRARNLPLVLMSMQSSKFLHDF